MYKTKLKRSTLITMNEYRSYMHYYSTISWIQKQCLIFKELFQKIEYFEINRIHNKE